MLASALAVGPGLGTDRIAAAAAAPAAAPPTAAEGQPESAPPDDGTGDEWGDEDTVPEEAGTPTDAGAAPGPAEAPATATPAAPPTGGDGTVAGGSGITKKPAPPPSGRKGIGLMIGAGAAGAVAWASTGALAGLISRSCVEGADGSDVGGTVSSCLTKVTSMLGLTVLKWIANDASYALAPAAGLVRGRWEASSYVYSGNHDRNGILFAGLGGGLLGLGIVGKVVLWGLIPRTLSCPTNPIEDYGPCVRRRYSGYLIGQQFMSSTIASGAGLLGYGIIYNKERKSRERLFFRPEQVRLTPNLSPEFTGMTLAGRF